MSENGKYILNMSNIEKSYPGVKALKKVRFNLKAGEVHALIGENGAGKSTLIKVLMGIVKKDNGEIRINGKSVDIRNSQYAYGTGISAVFQELSLIPDLTVAENVFLTRESTYLKTIIDRRLINNETKKILEKYKIDIDPNATVGSLTIAKRQLVEIVKAISINPKILIMDEPTASLTQIETEILFKIIKDLKEKGTGIIYISHRLDEIFKISDRVTVLRDGCYICENKTEEMDFDKIVKLIVGRDVELYKRVENESRIISNELALKVKNLCKHGVFNNVSFELKKGEVLGVAGLVGSGRTELMNLIFGIDRYDSGEILIDGEPVKITSVNSALKHGIVMIPENRHTQGLILLHTIEQNMSLPVLKRFKRFCLLNPRKIRNYVNEKIDQYNIKAEGGKKITNELSGGNQQKVVIAKWLATNPKILIIDEPTAGIDVHSKSEIHKIVQNLANKGLSVIMISSEMPELLVHSDRIIIVNDNEIVGTLNNPTQEEIMSIIMKDKIKQSKVQRGDR